MKTYELMTIIKQTLSEKEARSLFETIEKDIKDLDGEIVKSDFWGKRKFAYEIKGDLEGYYTVSIYKLDSSKISSFKTKLNLVEGLVRYLITAQS